jgi:predicted Zn-dependent protease with MMP-like domain
MKREDFVKVAEETLDSLPEEFRIRIQNVAILVEDFPGNQRPPTLGQRRRLLLGIFHGVPATKRRRLQPPHGTGSHRALPEEHRSHLRKRGRSSPSNSPDSHT